ncbi:MAG: filamentous hemagglutinin N-terminal domain-containing protein, partial [Candidatus Competibacterales bacterium]
MSPNRRYLPGIVGGLACSVALESFGQIVLDGSLGPAQALTGPDYAIPADLGRQAGANLFHSFGQFDLSQGESATFSGPSGVTAIVGRITNGQPSRIDGTVGSTIPGADLYLLNPAGVALGPNARLDVQGSFYASSADGLHFADGATLAVLDPAPVLSVAPVAAFGFVGADPAPVAATGSQLAVPAGETLALVGGDIALEA